ncbi:MAG: outer membrane beta-barrel protein [Acidobacteria bacterium]|nr:outer membrane beta-barrel protein [Acidobacteriota bacterium]
MRRVLVTATLGLLAALPATASASGVELRLGGFFPRAQSNLFTDDADLYNVDPKEDFRGVSGGIEFSVRLARNVELGFHLDGYGREVDTSYREFVREDGREILQTLKLDVVPVGVSLRLVPTSRRARLAPYLAAGVDLFFWNYEEFGDFVDFEDPELNILADHFVSDGVVPGFHVAGGVRVPLNRDLSVTGEVRYQVAKETDMGGDFFRATDKNQLDLTGASATIGVHLRF